MRGVGILTVLCLLLTLLAGAGWGHSFVAKDFDQLVAEAE
jgi:hypothetical protein